MLGIARDITEHKHKEEDRIKLEQRLAQSQKMEAVGQLTEGIAHDFKNILAAVLGFSHLARDRIKGRDDEKLEQYLNEVIKGGDRASKLVDEMLIFGRAGVEAAKAISVDDIVIDTMKLLEGMLPSSIKIQLYIGEDIPPVLIDPIQLEQMLMNLRINARDAMHEVGRLNIEIQNLHIAEDQTEIPSVFPDTKGERIDMCFCQKESPLFHTGDYVELSVMDTGSGISNEELGHIFEPFYTTKEVGKGTGMGLAMVHGIMQGAKGHIVVETKEDKGMLFRLLFKARETTETGELSVGVEDELPVRNDSGCILLVEDEEPILDFMEKRLSSYGYEVKKSVNGEEALTLFQAAPEIFSLVIADQTMPKMTGVNLSKQLLEIRPDIPIILCTGYSPLINAARAKEIGIQGFLMKPIESQKLLAMIQELSPGTSETHLS